MRRIFAVAAALGVTFAVAGCAPCVQRQPIAALDSPRQRDCYIASYAQHVERRPDFVRACMTRR